MGEIVPRAVVKSAVGRNVINMLQHGARLSLARNGRASAAFAAGSATKADCSYAATQRMPVIAMTAKNTTQAEELRLPAPLVYADDRDADRWLVDPPGRAAAPTAFTGPNACQAALEFAHRTYGCARYLARR